MGKYEDIHFRVKNTEEKEIIAKAAKDAGMNMSEFARKVLLAASNYQVTDNTNVGEKELREIRNGKTRTLLLRISEEELKFYIEQAEKIPCSVSEYIRRSANKNQIVVLPGLKEITKQIAKLGVNINQLTTLAHQGRIKEVDLFACNDTLQQILKELIKLKKGQ